MLITFTTPAYADITYFGDIAKQLLKMMGQTGSVPGAILANDVSEALELLKKNISMDNDVAGNPNDDEGDRHVTLVHRALPLIELLTAAEKAKEDVTWR